MQSLPIRFSPAFLARRIRGPLANAIHSVWFWIVFSGYVGRLILMPLTGQHDILFMPWTAHFILTDGNLNIYQSLYDKFGTVVLTQPAVWTPYPYGFYGLTTIWMAVLNSLHLVNIARWTTVWDVDFPARYVFLFKLPYLLFDLGIGLVLFRRFGIKAWALWSWSTAAWYTPFLMGQNDIYATAFLAFGLAAAGRAIHSRYQGAAERPFLPSKWESTAAFLLGLGGAFKFFPLLILVPIAFVLKESWRGRILLILSGSAVTCVSILPFVMSPAFTNAVLLNGESTGLFREIPSVFGLPVSPFLVGYLLLLLFIHFSRRAFRSEAGIWQLGLVVFAWLFMWIPTPFYWLLWITPLLCVAAVLDRQQMVGWVLIQSVFPILLIMQSAEFGIALPMHLATEFHLQNLLPALNIANGALASMVTEVWPVVNSVLLGALCLVVAIVLIKWKQGSGETDGMRPLSAPLIFAPMASFALVAFAIAYFSSPFLQDFTRYPGTTLTVRSGDILTQTILAPRDSMTGVSLTIVGRANPNSSVEVCVRSLLAPTTTQCVRRPVTHLIDGHFLILPFSRPLSVIPGSTLTAEFHLTPQSAPVDLSLVESNSTAPIGTNLEVNGAHQPRHTRVDLRAVYPFRIDVALSQLIIHNIVGDGALILVWILSLTATFLYVAWHVGS